jgi:hypothetical protein
MAQLAKRFVGGGKQLVMIFRCQLDIGGTQAAHRCFRRRHRCAQVVADRREQRRPHPVGLRDGPGGLGLHGRGRRLPGAACGIVREQAYHHREHGDQAGEHAGSRVQLAAQDGGHDRERGCQHRGHGISGSPVPPPRA